jgi:hypothetical protein
MTQATLIRGSDGLDYENLTERLLGNPAKTHRNAWLQRFRREGRSEAFISAWTEAYEGFEGRVGPGGGRVNSFHNTISALKVAETVTEGERRAIAHVAGLAADGFYDRAPAAPAPSR